MKTKTSSKNGRATSAAMRVSAKAPTAQAKQEIALSPDDIAYRAYLHFQRHGSANGHDVQDWLQAEAELSSEHAMAGRD